MELLDMRKRSSFDNYTINLDTLFDAFRQMERTNINKITIKNVIYTLSNPIQNLWFVHGFDDQGTQIATATFDHYDL